MKLLQMMSPEGKLDGLEQLLRPCASKTTDSATTGNQNPPQGSSLMKEFEILRTLSRGKYSKILLARKQGEKMVLKAVQCEQVNTEEFQRELDTNYFLSPHPNILTSYNVSFVWNQAHVFVQEYAPYGDLGRYMKKRAPGGLKDEAHIKLITKQIASALDFMHSSARLVHGIICPENILLFQQDMSLVKLCDFGSAQQAGSLVVRTHRHTESSQAAFLCPEVTETLPLEKYYVNAASDVWGLGILLYFCLNGSGPWQKADITDSNYAGYLEWHKRKCIRMPDSFKTFTPRLLRLLKRLLEPKQNKRCEVKEVFKYLKDEWIEKACQAGRKDSGTNNEKGFVTRQRSVSTSPAITTRKISQKHSRAKSLKAIKLNFDSRKGSDTRLEDGGVKRSTSYVK